jgi:hypothetical protein
LADGHAAVRLDLSIEVTRTGGATHFGHGPLETEVPPQAEWVAIMSNVTIGVGVSPATAVADCLMKAAEVIAPDRKRPEPARRPLEPVWPAALCPACETSEPPRVVRGLATAFNEALECTQCGHLHYLNT